MSHHSELAMELRAQTGKGAEIDALTDLLLAVSGRRYGLPQQSEPSDLLAEAYLALLERRTIRAGVKLIRYNDDFRMLCHSWAEVVRAIEILSEQARRLGLFLNDSKVVTYKVATYRNVVESASSLRVAIAHEVEWDLTHLVLGYDGDVVEVYPEDAEVAIGSSLRLLKMWNEIAGDGSIAEGERARHSALVNLLPTALWLLATSQEMVPGVLPICRNLLVYEQTLTPAVSSYLARLQDREALYMEVVNLFSADGHLSGWQVWWLCRLFPDGGVEVVGASLRG